ncbi:hypothetical protein FRB99_003422, partial [Tulasnella sp. 403]
RKSQNRMAPSVLASPPPAVPTVSLTTSHPQVPNPPYDAHSNSHHLKIKHRSSKPILAWVQRKLASAGAGAAKNAKDHPSATVSGGTRTRDGSRHRNAPINSNELGVRGGGEHPRHGQRKSNTHPAKGTSRRKSVELMPMPNGPPGKKDASMRRKAVHNHTPHPLQLPANEALGTTGVLQAYNSDSAPPSPRSTSLSFSIAPGSTWSNPPEADDDASTRPIPPTSPPSPAPSRSTYRTISSYTSVGYLSDPRTFQSGAASTKPTTLLSIDVGHTMAHIAQAPPSTTGAASSVGGGNSPSSPSFARFPSTSRHGGHSQGANSVSFSTVQSSSGTRHPLASTQLPENDSNSAVNLGEERDSVIMQAPNLSHPHPRNNPRPSSPPLDNASTLTLASSTFALSPRQHGAASIISRFPGSVSLHGGNRGSSVIGLGLEGYEGDPDASVRALRPRSRRGSWESVASTETGWSAAVKALGPAARKPAVGSVRTGDDVDEEIVEERSIRHAQIDEVDTETDSQCPAANEDATKDGSTVEPSARFALPITLILPTPNDSHVTTPTREASEPSELPVPKKSPASGHRDVESDSRSVTA